MPSLDNTIATFSYLSKNPYISIKDLSRYEHDCPICHESYYPSTSSDQPIKLRCGHVIGINCVARYTFSRTSDNACPICHAPIADEPDKESYSGSTNALTALLAVFHDRLVTTETRELLLKEMQGKLDGRNMILLAAYLESLDGSLNARDAALGTLHSATPQSQSSLEQYLPIVMILPLPGIFVGVLMVCGYSDHEIRMINLVFYVLLFFYELGMRVKKEGNRAVLIALGLAVVFCLFCL